MKQNKLVVMAAYERCKKNQDIQIRDIENSLKHC
jgi:hypothetical protein